MSHERALTQDGGQVALGEVFFTHNPPSLSPDDQGATP
jgi:hypothetical protein